MVLNGTAPYSHCNSSKQYRFTWCYKFIYYIIDHLTECTCNKFWFIWFSDLCNIFTRSCDFFPYLLSMSAFFKCFINPMCLNMVKKNPCLINDSWDQTQLRQWLSFRTDVIPYLPPYVLCFYRINEGLQTSLYWPKRK